MNVLRYYDINTKEHEAVEGREGAIEVVVVGSDAIVQQDIQARATSVIDIFAGTVVAAGASATSAVQDLSQFSMVRYALKTSSTGAGTANTIVAALESSSGYYDSFASTINSNISNWRRTTVADDMKGFPVVYYKFTNADTQSITLDLRAYTQV